jgi:hypothetical protein
MSVDAKPVNESLVSSDVTSSSTKRLGESSHEHINVSARLNAEVVANASAVRTHRTDRVSFINEEVELEILLDTNGRIKFGTHLVLPLQL